MITIVRMPSWKVFLHQRFWLHVSGWLAFFATPFILPVPLFRQLPSYFFYYLVVTKIVFDLVLIAIFYLNLLYLTPQLLLNRNIIRYLAYLGLLLMAVILLDYAFFRAIHDDLSAAMASLRMVGPHGLPRKELISPFQIVANMLLFLLIILASSLWAVVSDRLREQEFGQQMLYEKTSAELALLRQQVSPHFLFNTLNNIRWLARVKSARAEDSIMELSEILRYMLYHANREKVELTKEITYLSRYVNLQKLRLHPRALVEFHCQGDISGVEIEPLLFIPFVENAFKYGISPGLASLIVIRIEASGCGLLFECRNPIMQAAPQVFDGLSAGIGIQNVRRRLEMYYPETHSLRIDDRDGDFVVELKINHLTNG